MAKSKQPARQRNNFWLTCSVELADDRQSFSGVQKIHYNNPRGTPLRVLFRRLLDKLDDHLGTAGEEDSDG